ncbi:hypothetical protein ACH495_15940 [Micromonospora sp. NPDC018662]|uniref:hypothetical protein n=1 Tax=Micromonospora sp. NPDC018662 TaxID=3364238 RepID=UPI0037AB91A8
MPAGGRLIREFTVKGRVVTLARYALFVEAAVRPAIEAGRARLAEWGVPLARYALGSTDPPAHFRSLLALVDGLLGNQLATPDDAFDPESAVAALLHGFHAG